MNKILLLACLCLVASTSAFADIIQGESRTTETIYIPPKPKKEVKYPRYQGELNMVLTAPLMLGGETIHGVRVNKYFFAGAGIGVHGLFESEKEIDGIDYNVGTEENAPRFALFANVKGYLPVNELFSPYLNLSLGYGIGDEYESGNSGSGLLFDFGVGFKCSILNVGLGYMHQGGFEGYSSRVNRKIVGDLSLNMFYFNIGFCW